MVTKTSLVAMFPEFSSESDDRVTLFADFAAKFVNRTVLGSKADLAHHYMTAHMLYMANRKGASGTVTEEQVGPLRTAYSAPSTSDANDLDQSSYGMLLKGLQRTRVRTPLVV